ncbi:MAG: DUF971 domain-containing protein [Spongiibacteraceae bacterium]
MSLNSCAVIGGNLAFGWNDRQIELSGAVLRRHCRCAECRYQSLTGNAAATSDEVDIVAGSPLGYGIQLHFSDGHIRGVFPWTYLLEIADASLPSD